MAPLPVIGNVVRLDLQWPAVAGVPSHSTFHIITNSTDVEQIGLDVGAAFEAAEFCWNFHYSSSPVVDVLVTPLDGDTAGQLVPMGTSAVVGTGSGGVLPATCAVLSFRTLSRGPKGRGRIYIGPMGEADIEDGLVSSSKRDTAVAAWQDFNTELAASDTAGSLCVASYVHAEAAGVTAITMRRPAGTMRRRQDQLT